MTIEEKAKVYDEALEKAKMSYHTGDYDKDTLEMLEIIFPELAENKDERIRKALKQYFVNSFKNNGVAAICGVHVKDVLAWLEKQGEKHQNPYNGISFEYNGHIWGMCARDNGVDISCDKHLIKHLEKQGEQKPAEWTEEDINMIDWLIRCCEEEHKELCNDKYGHQDIVSDLKSDCRKKWDWLESLKNRVAPQNHWKPSDEQMGCLSDAIEHYNSLGYPAPKLKELLDDLKKLKEGKV